MHYPNHPTITPSPPDEERKVYEIDFCCLANRRVCTRFVLTASRVRLSTSSQPNWLCKPTWLGWLKRSSITPVTLPLTHDTICWHALRQRRQPVRYFAVGECAPATSHKQCGCFHCPQKTVSDRLIQIISEMSFADWQVLWEA